MYSTYISKAFVLKEVYINFMFSGPYISTGITFRVKTCILVDNLWIFDFHIVFSLSAAALVIMVLVSMVRSLAHSPT